MMRRLFALLGALSFAGLAGWIYLCLQQPLPSLREGDLIFHTSFSSQSRAILIATASPYTHMGIIAFENGQSFVIEAVGPVKETPLKEWLHRGLGFATIYRYRDLTTDQGVRIIAAAKSFYGRPYNPYFSFQNEGIYCSELAYLAYKADGLPIGSVQKVAELHFDNFLVRDLIMKRLPHDPECKADGYDLNLCYQHLLDREMVTPASIASDIHFNKVYSSYPF